MMAFINTHVENSCALRGARRVIPSKTTNFHRVIITDLVNGNKMEDVNQP